MQHHEITNWKEKYRDVPLTASDSKHKQMPRYIHRTINWTNGPRNICHRCGCKPKRSLRQLNETFTVDHPLVGYAKRKKHISIFFLLNGNGLRSVCHSRWKIYGAYRPVNHERAAVATISQLFRITYSSKLILVFCPSHNSFLCLPTGKKSKYQLIMTCHPTYA